MREDPLFNIIPGYREAVERESALREVAFLPITETLCGKEVLPFAPVHLAALTVIRSPFAVGGIPSESDIALFLWAVSAEYKPDAAFRRWRFVRSCRKLDYLEAIAAIQSYLDDAFADGPGSKGGFRVSYYSTTAAAVDLVASQYGWAEGAILKMPFKRLFQYARCVKERNVSRPIFFNQSDLILAEWQEAQEQKRREAQQAVKHN
jgi:hypothetical protein